MLSLMLRPLHFFGKELFGAVSNTNEYVQSGFPHGVQEKNLKIEDSRLLVYVRLICCKINNLCYLYSKTGGIMFVPNVGNSFDTTQNRRKLKSLSVPLQEPQHPERNEVLTFRVC
jgi:hypothetical protein